MVRDTWKHTVVILRVKEEPFLTSIACEERCVFGGWFVDNTVRDQVQTLQPVICRKEAHLTL
jgi:hypothetical protein